MCFFVGFVVFGRLKLCVCWVVLRGIAVRLGYSEVCGCFITEVMFLGIRVFVFFLDLDVVLDRVEEFVFLGFLCLGFLYGLFLFLKYSFLLRLVLVGEEFF